MNKLLCLAAAVSAVLLSGCLQIPQGLNKDEQLKQVPQGNTELTFSAEQVIDGPFLLPDGLSTQKALAGRIGEVLKQSGAFKKVEYRPFSRRGAFHIHFTAHYFTELRRELFLAAGLIGIPSRIPSYLDVTAIVYKNDKAVYCPTISDGMHNYVWVVFLPAGLVWNSWWAWSTQEKKCVRILVNRITGHQPALQ